MTKPHFGILALGEKAAEQAEVKPDILEVEIMNNKLP